MSSTFAPTEVAGYSALNRAEYEGYVYARLLSPLRLRSARTAIIAVAVPTSILAVFN